MARRTYKVADLEEQIAALRDVIKAIRRAIKDAEDGTTPLPLLDGEGARKTAMQRIERYQARLESWPHRWPERKLRGDPLKWATRGAAAKHRRGQRKQGAKKGAKK